MTPGFGASLDVTFGATLAHKRCYVTLLPTAVPTLCHHPFQPLLSTLPIGHNLVEKLEKRRAVMWHRDMAKLVSDHVVDGVNRGLYEAAIEEQASRRRHRPPSLSGLPHDETLRAESLGIREEVET